MEKLSIKTIIGIIFLALIVFIKREYPVSSSAQINPISGAASPLLSAGTSVSGGASVIQEKQQINGSSLEDSSAPGAQFKRINSDPAPEVTAVSAVIGDLGDGSVYFEKEPGRRWPLASLTKLMTAEAAIDAIDGASVVTFYPTFSGGGDQATKESTSSKTEYFARDLIKMMLVGSVNDAAESLALFYGRERFLALMNKKAADLNLNDTYFDDASGLSASNQSTAQDIFLLAQDVYKNYPQIFTITRNTSVSVTELIKNEKQTVKSTNIFAGEPEFLGGKTGNTPEASGNLVSVFSVGGRPVFFAVLGTSDRFGETTKLFDWFRGSYKL